MLRLAFILLVIMIALLRGGALRNFASLQLRWLPLVIIGFVLQLLIFTPYAANPIIAFATLPIYIVSLLLVVTWVLSNWRIPGMALVAVGLLLNIIVIAANNGHMPVSADAARAAGKYEMLIADDPQIAKHVLAVDGQTRLLFLGDIIPIPQVVPGAVVWSIGDVMLTAGIAILCYRTIRGWPNATSNASGTPTIEQHKSTH